VRAHSGSTGRSQPADIAVVRLAEPALASALEHVRLTSDALVVACVDLSADLTDQLARIESARTAAVLRTRPG